MAKPKNFQREDAQGVDQDAPGSDDSGEGQYSPQDGSDDGSGEPLTDGRVMVNVPTAFKLTTDDHRVHEYPSGRMPMLSDHADHPYAKAHGVTKIEE